MEPRLNRLHQYDASPRNRATIRPAQNSPFLLQHVAVIMGRNSRARLLALLSNETYCNSYCSTFCNNFPDKYVCFLEI